MIYGLDLFSGIGGLTLALKPWVRPIAYCECDEYAQAVLLSRMADGILPRAPIWDDVRTLQIEMLPLRPDLICGGFPCQDISVAGNGAGLEGKRSGLFFEIARLISDGRPRFVFLENVPAITTRGGVEVIETFTAMGYDCRWGVLSAFDVGAPHRRERWWLLATDSNGIGIRYGSKRMPRGRPGRIQAEGQAVIRNDGAKKHVANASRLGCEQVDPKSLRSIEGMRKEGRPSGSSNCGEDMANADGSGCARPRQAQSEKRRSHIVSTGPGKDVSHGDGEGLEIGEGKRRDDAEKLSPTFRNDWWATEPNVGRVADGVPHRVHRIRSLGNSVVPAQAREAFERLAGLKKGWE